jgi:DNA-binding transcriptional MerR regulator
VTSHDKHALPTEPAERQRYTIDELTTATGIASRTIRFYQSAGALPPPVKIGRIGYYGPEHIERLELIARLQDRGLRMRAIKDLVERIEHADHGEQVLDEWLGLGEQLQSSWSDDRPQAITSTQLTELAGEPRPGFLAALIRSGLIEPQGDERWLVHSPGLLHVAAQLDRAGVNVEVAIGAGKILHEHMSKAASELAGYFAEHAGDGFGTTVPHITEAFRVLKPLGLESVRLMFAREMEQVLRRMVESGEAGKLDKPRRRRRR